MADDERREPADGGDDVVEPTASADPNESPAAGEEDAAAAAGPGVESGASEPSAEAEPPTAADEEQEASQPEPAAEEPAEPAAAPADPAAEERAEPEAAPADPAAEERAEPEAAPAERQPAAVEPGEPDEQQPAAEAQPAAEEQPGDEERQARRERARRPRRRGEQEDKAAEEVVPGAHLEPDLVLEEAQREDDEFGRYAVVEEDEEQAPAEAAPTEAAEREQPVPRTPMDLAADARYRATGKRKTAVARVILRPGDGRYSINGRALDEFFPRETLRLMARQPLETAGYASRLDVVAKVHGGGMSSQAGAVRHGIARALVEADPNLRGELKRRGFLTRDARVKERKKAGLKKARKRPQFSKR